MRYEMVEREVKQRVGGHTSFPNRSADLLKVKTFGVQWDWLADLVILLGMQEDVGDTFGKILKRNLELC